MATHDFERPTSKPDEPEENASSEVPILGAPHK